MAYRGRRSHWCYLSCDMGPATSVREGVYRGESCRGNRILWKMFMSTYLAAERISILWPCMAELYGLSLSYLCISRRRTIITQEP